MKILADTEEIIVGVPVLVGVEVEVAILTIPVDDERVARTPHFNM